MSDDAPVAVFAAALSWALRGVMHDVNGAIAPLAVLGAEVVDSDDRQELGDCIVEISMRLSARVADLHALVRSAEPVANLEDLVPRVLRLLQAPLRHAVVVRMGELAPVRVPVEAHHVTHALVALLFGLAGSTASPPTELSVALSSDGGRGRVSFVAQRATPHLDAAAAYARTVLGPDVVVDLVRDGAEVRITLRFPAAG